MSETSKIPSVDAPSIPLHFQKVALIGVGLLGGSLGLRLQTMELSDEVVGYVRRAGSVEECQRVGAVTRVTTDLKDAVAGAGLVILCTPVAQMGSMAKTMLPFLRSGTLVTDVGSTKSKLVAELEAVFTPAGIHFVGSHPMAGSEKTGPINACSDLFRNKLCLLTPTHATNPQALLTIRALWEQIGCSTVQVTPQIHDELVCRASHLPHILATALVRHVLRERNSWEEPSLQSRICASGFRDTTRIASGSPEMWRDIVLSNREPLLRELDAYMATLQTVRKTLANGTPEEIQHHFESARNLRNEWLDLH